MHDDAERPFLGTGHGRSGTLWTAKFFTNIGFPTYHERQFSPVRSLELAHSEVSWLAVPFLSSLPAGTKVLRVVRNPYDAVVSGMQMDFQQRPGKTSFDRFMEEHRPDIAASADKLTRIIRWVAMWDSPVDEIPHEVIRPDVDTLDRLGEVVEYVTGVSVPQEYTARVCHQLGSKINTKTVRKDPTTRKDIDGHPEGWRIRERAERFGYA
jgi:hypothetical protein